MLAFGWGSGRRFRNHAGPWGVPPAARGSLWARAADCVVSAPPPRGEGPWTGSLGAELQPPKGKGATGELRSP